MLISRRLVRSLVLAASLTRVAWGADEKLVGPMNELLPRGTEPAPASGGLAFVLAVSRDGIPNESFELRIPGASGSLSLSLAPLYLEGSSLVGEVRLVNRTGVPLLGLRLDILQATESAVEHDAMGQEVKDASGRPKEISRPQTISFRSPLLLGDLADGGESSPVRFLVE
ncbi:MAG: hypothetical protein ABIT01_00600, partial [Thermoanaerobaculia bacterium]